MNKYTEAIDRHLENGGEITKIPMTIEVINPENKEVLSAIDFTVGPIGAQVITELKTGQVIRKAVEKLGNPENISVIIKVYMAAEFVAAYRYIYELIDDYEKYDT